MNRTIIILALCTSLSMHAMEQQEKTQANQDLFSSIIPKSIVTNLAIENETQRKKGFTILENLDLASQLALIEVLMMNPAYGEKKWKANATATFSKKDPRNRMVLEGFRGVLQEERNNFLLKRWHLNAQLSTKVSHVLLRDLKEEKCKESKESAELFEKLWEASQEIYYEQQVNKLAQEVDTLLTQGAHIDAQIDYVNGTSLSYAVAKGRVDLAQLFIKRGANINAHSGIVSWPLLKRAAHNKDGHMIKFLLDNGANPDGDNTLSNSPITIAAENKDWNNAVLLIEDGANPNTKDFTPPLVHAIKQNNVIMITYLLENGASPNSSYYESPLQVAFDLNYLDVANLLLKKDADPNEQYHGESLLELFVKARERDKTALLLKYNATISGEALFAAAKNKDLDMLKLLEQYGANFKSAVLNIYDRNDIHSASAFGLKTILHQLILKDCIDFDIFTYLIEHGVDINKPSEWHDRTPLLEAVSKKNVLLARYLIEHGAKIHCKDDCCNTPMSLAVANNDPKMVKLLLDSTSFEWDPTLASAYSHANYSNYKEIIDLLKPYHPAKSCSIM